MRPDSIVFCLAACLAPFAQIAAAFPEPTAPPILPRAGDNTQVNDNTATGEPSSAQQSDTASVTGNDNASETGKNLNTAHAETGTAKGGKGKHTTTVNHHKTFNVQDPVGGVQILTPQTTVQPTPLFKVGDYVTLAWNYTGVQATPTGIDVLLSCSTASATWTLTANMSYQSSVNYVWNSKKQADDQEQPLLTNLYTLIIKEADAEITQQPQAGYLGSNSQFTFAMYTPEYAGLKCDGCSAASTTSGKHALGVAVMMSVITVFSFTWFVSGFALQ